jgi:hypothetical protein
MSIAALNTMLQYIGTVPPYHPVRRSVTILLRQISSQTNVLPSDFNVLDATYDAKSPEYRTQSSDVFKGQAPSQGGSVAIKRLRLANQSREVSP